MANLYTCSDGEKVNQRQINARLAREKKGFIERYICESCEINRNHFAAWSHTISQKRCKELHRTELIWLEGNGSWDCHECHLQWESYKSGQFQDHKNFKQRMRFMLMYDEEGFRKRLNYVTYPHRS